MSRLTQLEEIIKSSHKEIEEYKIKLNVIRRKVLLLTSSDNQSWLEAVDSAEEVIDILFHRYQSS